MSANEKLRRITTCHTDVTRFRAQLIDRAWKHRFIYFESASGVAMHQMPTYLNKISDHTAHSVYRAAPSMCHFRASSVSWFGSFLLSLSISHAVQHVPIHSLLSCGCLLTVFCSNLCYDWNMFEYKNKLALLNECNVHVLRFRRVHYLFYSLGRKLMCDVNWKREYQCHFGLVVQTIHIEQVIRSQRWLMLDV